MVCPHCQGADKFFNVKAARRELKGYKKNGPNKATRILLNILRKSNVQDMTLLDIGGGIGAIQHELAADGIKHSLDVDASSSYLQIAKDEAGKRGYGDRADYLHGDFVQLADQIEAADIVTLDRAICCYPDVQALVNLSSQRAKRYYAVVYPVDYRIAKIGAIVLNFLAFKLWGNPFRTFIHSRKKVDAIIQNNGLELIHQARVGFWRVFVYERQIPSGNY